MAIKHKVLKDFQLLTDDKKILILKAKTLLEDYKFKNKSEIVTVPAEVIRNNPDYFAHIDWKEELQSYLKVNKIPQPAVITKKILPFIENLIDELGTKTKEVIVEREVIVEKPITVEKEIIVEKQVLVDKPKSKVDSDIESRLKKVDILQSKLQQEIDEANNKEAEYIAKFSQLDSKEKSLKKKEGDLGMQSNQLQIKSDELSKLEDKLNGKLSEYNSLIYKTDVINLCNEFPTDVPEHFRGFFGNSLQYEQLSSWYRHQIELLISKIDEKDIM
jgi:hypothetical protein